MGAIPKAAAEITGDFVMGGTSGAGLNLLARGARSLGTPRSDVASEIADFTTQPGGAANLERLNELNQRLTRRDIGGQRARNIGAAAARVSGAESAR